MKKKKENLWTVMETYQGDYTGCCHITMPNWNGRRYFKQLCNYIYKKKIVVVSLYIVMLQGPGPV